MLKIKFLFTAILAVLLAGCSPSSSKWEDLPAAADGKTYESAAIIIDPASVAAYPDYAKTLQTLLYQRLSSSGFSTGQTTEDDVLVLNCKIIQADEGSRVARYVVGFGAGEGAFDVDVEFTNSAGESLGTIQVNGKIVMGVFGGEFDTAIDSAATEIVTAAKRKFGR